MLTGLGENVFTMVGAATTVYGAEAGFPATASPMRATPEVVLVNAPPGATPTTVLVITQLVPIPRVPPANWKLAVPFTAVTVPPPQLPTAAVASFCNEPGYASVNATPVTAIPVLFVRVKVIVDAAPPTSNTDAEKAFVIETLPENNVADAVVPVPPLVEVTFPVVFTSEPAAVAMT